MNEQPTRSLVTARAAASLPVLLSSLAAGLITAATAWLAT